MGIYDCLFGHHRCTTYAQNTKLGFGGEGVLRLIFTQSSEKYFSYQDLKKMVEKIELEKKIKI